MNIEKNSTIISRNPHRVSASLFMLRTHFTHALALLFSLKHPTTSLRLKKLRLRKFLRSNQNQYPRTQKDHKICVGTDRKISKALFFRHSVNGSGVCDCCDFCRLSRFCRFVINVISCVNNKNPMQKTCFGLLYSIRLLCSRY